MIDWIPYGLLHRYPHMAPLDVAIWVRYLRAYPAAFDAVAYDVAVGEGAQFDTVVNPATGGDVGRIYQRRIDVIGKKDGVHTIVEVKPRASTAALGQIKGYARLAARDFPEIGTPRLLVVTDELVPEMEFLAGEEGVEIIVV